MDKAEKFLEIDKASVGRFIDLIKVVRREQDENYYVFGIKEE